MKVDEISQANNRQKEKVKGTQKYIEQRKKIFNDKSYGH